VALDIERVYRQLRFWKGIGQQYIESNLEKLTHPSPYAYVSSWTYASGIHCTRAHPEQSNSCCGWCDHSVIKRNSGVDYLRICCSHRHHRSTSSDKLRVESFLRCCAAVYLLLRGFITRPFHTSVRQTHSVRPVRAQTRQQEGATKLPWSQRAKRSEARNRCGLTELKRSTSPDVKKQLKKMICVSVRCTFTYRGYGSVLIFARSPPSRSFYPSCQPIRHNSSISGETAKKQGAIRKREWERKRGKFRI